MRQGRQINIVGLVLVLILLMVSMPGGVVGAEGTIVATVNYRGIYESAEKLYGQKKYEEVIQQVDKLRVLLQSSNSRIEYILAKAFLKAGFPKRAMASSKAFFLMTPESEFETGYYKEMTSLRQELEIVLAASSIQHGDLFIEPYTGLELVYLQGGCFQMGDVSGVKYQEAQSPVHEVCVSGFFMGKYEVTSGQWRRIMGGSPGGRAVVVREKDALEYPVTNVSWFLTQDYIAKLNQKSAKKFRLPTEAEWEYAARAGTATKYVWGDTYSCEYANFENDTRQDIDCVPTIRQKGLPVYSSARVGSYPANGFGLFDMAGNVWEWCQDWSGPYGEDIRLNPLGTAGTHRVVRGGSSYVGHKKIFVAYRSGRRPYEDKLDLGFRLVLPVETVLANNTN